MNAAVQGPARKVDPESLALRAAPRPVVRLDRRMLVVSAGLLSAVVLGATLWSLQSPRKGREAPIELHNVERITRSETLDRLPRDYGSLAPPRPASEVPVLGPPLPGDLGPAVLEAERRAHAGMAGANPGDVPSDRLAALREIEEAMRSPVFFRGNGGSGSSKQGLPASVEPTPRVSGPPSLETGLAMASGVAAPADPTAMQNRQDQKLGFLSPSASDAVTRQAGGLQPPVSPYQVMAGTVIPAALLTGIDSDLPGQVIASVTEPVHDTASGKHLLIPQGSRLVGHYDSHVAFGQRRVLLVWTRLILPDTSSIALDRLPGMDPAGYAGLEDGVDWHWDRLLAGAALSTLLGIGAELAGPTDRSGGDRVVVAAREGAQDTVNRVGQEITRRSLDVQPTLTIRPGFLLRVMVGKDLVLRPYRPLFFERGTSP